LEKGKKAIQLSSYFVKKKNCKTIAETFYALNRSLWILFYCLNQCCKYWVLGETRPRRGSLLIK